MMFQVFALAAGIALATEEAERTLENGWLPEPIPNNVKVGSSFYKSIMDYDRTCKPQVNGVDKKVFFQCVDNCTGPEKCMNICENFGYKLKNEVTHMDFGFNAPKCNQNGKTGQCFCGCYTQCDELDFADENEPVYTYQRVRAADAIAPSMAKNEQNDCNHNYLWYQNSCAAASYPIVTTGSCSGFGYEEILTIAECKEAAGYHNAKDDTVDEYNNGAAPLGCFVTEENINGKSGLILNSTDMKQALCSETKQCICKNPLTRKEHGRDLHFACKSRGCLSNKKAKTCAAVPMKEVPNKRGTAKFKKTKLIKCNELKAELVPGDKGEALCGCFGYRENPHRDTTSDINNHLVAGKLMDQDGCRFDMGYCRGPGFRFRDWNEE